MSEYQYYEFQTIDRRLDEKEMQDLRGYSSRAHITPTSFTNEYSFGSFKGNADAWMEKYFDAYLYVANWGTHELQIRVPARLLSAGTARGYCAGEAASVREKAGNVIFTFLSNEEGGGEWVEAGGVLSSILPMRNDLIGGDLRVLYLGWLLCVQEGELDDDSVEPPLPPNLRNLTASLSNLADFLRIDSDLIAVAAEASPSRKLESVDRRVLAAWVASLPAAEKDDWLVRMMEGKEAHIGTELRSRFNCAAMNVLVADQRRRTVGELLAAAKTREQNRRIEENRKAAREKMERERLAAIAREKHLDSIVARVPELWRRIEDLIATRQTKSYDLAMQLLVDLRDLARRQVNEVDFAKRAAALREAHSRKPSFLARLHEKGM